MRKLKLDVESLSVHSFTTSGARGVRGTAHAHAIGGDAAYITDPGDDTSVQPGDTGTDVCFTCEASCGTRGC